MGRFHDGYFVQRNENAAKKGREREGGRERRKYKVPPIKQLTSAKPVCLIAPAWQTSCLKG